MKDPRRPLITGLMLALTLSLPACDRFTASEEPADQQRAYTRCMREHGIDMPDSVPEPQGTGPQMATAVPIDLAAWTAAHEACRQHLPNGGEATKPDAEALEKLRKHAKCMRDLGFNYPDPDADGNIPPIAGGEPAPGGKSLFEAENECRAQ